MHKYILRVYKYFSEKMKWKALFAVIIVLGILGALFLTDVGKRYGDFLKARVGDFIAILTRRGPGGPPFGIKLTARKESFYGQEYRIVNSSFTGSGFYQYIKVGGQVISIKSGEEVNIDLKNLDGTFEYTNEGNVKVDGDATHVEIGDLTFTPETASRVEIEIVPFEFSLTGIESDISVPFVSGNIETDKGNAPLDNSKLDASYFSGSLVIEEDGSAVLGGTVSSVTGDNFSFK